MRGLAAATPLYGGPAMPKRVRQAVTMAAEEFNVQVSDILGPSRARNVAQARRRACRYLTRMQFSSVQIANYLGINHSSVLYHRRIDNGRTGRGPSKPVEVPCPDLSGEWAI